MEVDELAFIDFLMLVDGSEAWAAARTEAAKNGAWLG